MQNTKAFRFQRDSHSDYECKEKEQEFAWMKIVGRFGLSSLGAVYFMLGFLAVQFVVGNGSVEVDRQAAVQLLADSTFGQWMVIGVGVGFMAYSVYRIAGAVIDLDCKGKGKCGFVSRLAFAVPGILYGAAGASVIALSQQSREMQGRSSTEETAQMVLNLPLGGWILSGCGVLFIVYAFYQIYQSVSAGFMQKFNTGRMSDAERRIARCLGRVGIMARALALGIIGGLLVKAAKESDAVEAGGFGGALEVILNQPYGSLLMLIMGVGIMSYGVYTFFKVRYRRYYPAEA